MRTYEALFIVRPDLKDEEIQAVADGVETLIKDNGGAIVRSEIWGKRRLAYEVKHFNEGCYVLIRYQSNGKFPKTLEGHFRLSEPVIRWLITYFDEHDLKMEAEQQRRNEAELARSAERASRGERDEDDDDDRDRDRGRGRGRGRDRDDDDD